MFPPTLIFNEIYCEKMCKQNHFVKLQNKYYYKDVEIISTANLPNYVDVSFLGSTKNVNVDELLYNRTNYKGRHTTPSSVLAELETVP